MHLLGDARSDLIEALRINPNNAEARGELANVEQVPSKGLRAFSLLFGMW